MSVGLAELSFLYKAKWLDMYGADLHPVMVRTSTTIKMK